MYAIALIRYRRPLEEVAEVTEQHRGYLRGLKEEGILVASGPMDPRNGGVLLLNVPDDDVAATLDRVRDEDPYVTLPGLGAVRADSMGRGNRTRGPGSDQSPVLGRQARESEDACHPERERKAPVIPRRAENASLSSRKA